MSMQDVIDRVQEESPVTPEEVASWDSVDKSADEVETILRDMIDGSHPWSDMVDLEEGDVDFS